MFFEIQDHAKPLITAILNAVQNASPCDNQIDRHVSPSLHEVSKAHMNLVVEQLCVFGFVELIGQHLFITFEGQDLLNKLSATH